MSIVGENIKAERMRQHISQNALAKKAGIAQATLNAIEAETKNPSIDTVILLAKALGQRVSMLLGEVQDGDLSATESALLADFRSLNSQGQDYILQTVYTVCASGIFDSPRLHHKNAAEKRRFSL